MLQHESQAGPKRKTSASSAAAASAVPATAPDDAADAEKSAAKGSVAKEPTSVSAAVDGEVSFIKVLVTPKISFSVPRLARWTVAEDISQEELRRAFLTRFPIHFDAERLTFRSATPGLRLADAKGCVVFRISAEGAEEDRVLLSILSDIDKAYSAKYERQLELAHADMLSSSMTFQVVADEIRAGQQAAAKKWEKEVRSLKDQLQTNQKRLFLLEQEKDQLQKSAASSEAVTGQLRRDVESLSGENADLKSRMGDLEQQLLAMREFLVARDSLPAAQLSAARSPAELSEAATQTLKASGDDGGLAAERLEKQLTLMSDWLQDGVAILRDGRGLRGGQTSGGEPNNTSRRRVRERWSDLQSEED